MKRTLLCAVLLLVVAGLLIAPAVAALTDDGGESATTDPATIASYAADFLIAADGGLVGKETVTAQLPAGRHGISRTWDVTDPSDSHVRLDPHDITVRLDGRSVPFELSWEQGRRLRVAEIGDPDTTLDAGQHVYTIIYRIDGAVSAGSASSSPAVLDWDVVAPGWQMSMATTSSTIRLPAPSAQVRCTAGRDATAPCDVEGAGTDTIVVSTGAHAARTPVAVRVGLPGTPPDRVTVPWTVTWDGVLGRSVLGAGAAALLSVIALLLGHRLTRRPREDEPRLPVIVAVVVALALAVVAGLVLPATVYGLPLATLTLGAAFLRPPRAPHER